MGEEHAIDALTIIGFGFSLGVIVSIILTLWIDRR